MGGEPGEEVEPKAKAQGKPEHVLHPPLCLTSTLQPQTWADRGGEST